MTLRTLLRFQNPDSSQDINDRFKGLLNKGVFSGGDVEAVTSTLTVRLTPFATIGFDGMFVREDDDNNILAVEVDTRNYIVVRQRYVANSDPIVSVESLTEAQYVGDADPDALIVFAVVDVPAAVTEVLTEYVEFIERDMVDPIGRLSFRGLVATTAESLTQTGLPDWGTTSNVNRVGDFYIVTDGSGGFPELWAWNEIEWVNITQAQTMIGLLDLHRQDLDVDSNHVTDDQADALLGTVSDPDIDNRYVTDLDPRVPTQTENDALQPDPTAYSEFVPSDTNRFINSSKILAAPTEVDFAGGVGSIELQLASDGPFYVGFGTTGTAQQFFNIWARSATPQDDDQELLNSEFQPVRITGVFQEASLSTELNPALADSNGFYSGSNVYIQLDNPTTGTDFSIGFGKRVYLGDLPPNAFLLRGPLFGQVDARVRQILESSVNGQFDDSAWDVGTSPGDVVAFDSGSGKFIQANIATSDFPVGVRGNTNNLIAEGLYEFASSSVFSAGDQVYSLSGTPGALSTTPTNEWFIGTFFDDTRLLVNMNAFGITASTFIPGTAFPANLFDDPNSPLPGEVAAFNGTDFVQWDDSDPTTPHPDGLRGNSNNIIQVGLYQNPGTPYGVGLRYFCSTLSNGQLIASPNDYFAAHAISTSELLVNIIGTANWGDAQTVYDVEHDSSTGIHSEGSCRTFVGLVADAGISTSNSLASSTGMTLFATDTGQVFHCTDGSANTWVEASRFSGPLEITSTLEVGGNLILPTGILDDDAGTTFNVFTHGGRHASVDPDDDPLAGLIRQLSSDGDDGSSPVVLTGAYATLGSIFVDFTNRGGNSTILVFGLSNFNGTVLTCQVSMQFQMDGVAFASPQGVTAVHNQLTGTGNELFVVSQQGVFSTVSDTTHTITLEALVSVGGATAQARNFILIDLGPN